MKLLKDIIAQWGNIDKVQAQELSCYFPDTEVIIKWSFLPREKIKVHEVASRIAFVEGVQGDYCREVFIESKSFFNQSGISQTANFLIRKTFWNQIPP